jgi:hypothetical protein
MERGGLNLGVGGGGRGGAMEAKSGARLDRAWLQLATQLPGPLDQLSTAHRVLHTKLAFK